MRLCHAGFVHLVLMRIAEAELGWLQTETWNKLAGLLNQPIDGADGEGFIYAAYLEGAHLRPVCSPCESHARGAGHEIPPDELHIKFERSVDVSRRLTEWQARCPSCKRVCILSMRAQQCHKRLERMMLLVLQDFAANQAYRIPAYRRSRRTSHQNASLVVTAVHSRSPRTLRSARIVSLVVG